MDNLDELNPTPDSTTDDASNNPLPTSTTDVLTDSTAQQNIAIPSQPDPNQQQTNTLRRGGPGKH